MTARASRLLLLGSLLGSASLSAQGRPASASFERWAAEHAIPIVTLDLDTSANDLDRLVPVLRGARVVAIGEPAHGAHEPLAIRNRLMRLLVERLGFTAVALESGLPESRPIADFVASGAGSAEGLVRTQLTWGFGDFPENVRLIEWLRDYNRDPSHQRKVRFYGIDVSVGGPGGWAPSTASIEATLTYLTWVDSAAAARSRAALAPLLARLPAAGASFTTADHQRLTSGIDELGQLLERNRAKYVARSGRGPLEWALRTAAVARQEDRVFRASPAPAPDGKIAPTAWRAVMARDSGMAQNVLWALAQEGSEGKLVVFAHDGHVKAEPTRGGIWSGFERPPTVMGQYLRASLGRDVVIIGGAAGDNGPKLPPAVKNADGVDAALARVGPRAFVVDLREVPSGSAAAEWIAAPREIRANFSTAMIVAASKAFDLLYYVATLTPADPAAGR